MPGILGTILIHTVNIYKAPSLGPNSPSPIGNPQHRDKLCSQATYDPVLGGFACTFESWNNHAKQPSMQTFQATCILASSGWSCQNMSYDFAEKKELGLMWLQTFELENLRGSYCPFSLLFTSTVILFLLTFLFYKLKSHHFKPILLLKFCGTYGEYDQ